MEAIKWLYFGWIWKLNCLIKTKNKKDKWIKLICGASNEDIVAIEDLCAIYTAAGVDFIDVAAEESIDHAAKKGIEWAKNSLRIPLD